MYDFVDAQEMHLKHIETFEVPDAIELENLVPGVYVKICHNNERFWICLTNINKSLLSGKVDNTLISEHPFKYDDIIEFEKRHVFAVLKKD